METVGATALKGARVALHGAKVTAGYGISTAKVAGSYSLIASKALYAMAATLWASLAVACAVLVGGMCFLVSTIFEMSRRVKVASRGMVKIAQFTTRSVKLSIQASSYAGRVAVALWTRLSASASRGFEASLALFVVVSGLCLEAFLRARTAGAARAAPFLRKHAPMAADMLFESPKKNDDCEEALLLDLSPSGGYGATNARGAVDAGRCETTRRTYTRNGNLGSDVSVILKETFDIITGCGWSCATRANLEVPSGSARGPLRAKSAEAGMAVARQIFAFCRRRKSRVGIFWPGSITRRSGWARFAPGQLALTRLVFAGYP